MYKCTQPKISTYIKNRDVFCPLNSSLYLAQYMVNIFFFHIPVSNVNSIHWHVCLPLSPSKHWHYRLYSSLCTKPPTRPPIALCVPTLPLVALCAPTRPLVAILAPTLPLVALCEATRPLVALCAPTRKLVALCTYTAVCLFQNTGIGIF